jgi:mono/diheme cytochrome c family protein
MATSFFRFVLLATTLLLITHSCEQEPYQQGKNLYTKYCENCHMADGSGLGTNIPPLAQADFLENEQDIIACIIRYGITDTLLVNGNSYENPMAGIENHTEFQIANIINYINHAWGNDYGFVTVEDLRSQLKKCK